MRTLRHFVTASVAALIILVDMAWAADTVVPSQRGTPSTTEKSKNCQLNSMSISLSSFREGKRIIAKIVFVCNQPVDRALVQVQHGSPERKA